MNDASETVLARLRAAGSTVALRRATERDLPMLVALLAADQIGADRETADGTLAADYRRAFEAIDGDPAHLLVAGELEGDPAHPIVATMQLTVLPGLARRGASRLQIEAVRVDASLRGQGLGRALLEWAIDEARRRDCALVQLTSDKRRPDAHRFYGRLGFVDSHEGFKLHLPNR